MQKIRTWFLKGINHLSQPKPISPPAQSWSSCSACYGSRHHGRQRKMRQTSSHSWFDHRRGNRFDDTNSKGSVFWDKLWPLARLAWQIFELVTAESLSSNTDTSAPWAQ